MKQIHQPIFITGKKIVILGLLLVAVSALAKEIDHGKKLLDAITLCPKPNNPLENGLHALNGNQFGNITSVLENGSTKITVDVWDSPHQVNKSIGAPDVLLGYIEVKMLYKRKGGDNVLTCEIEKHRGPQKPKLIQAKSEKRAEVYHPCENLPGTVVLKSWSDLKVCPGGFGPAQMDRTPIIELDDGSTIYKSPGNRCWRGKPCLSKEGCECPRQKNANP